MWNGTESCSKVDKHNIGLVTYVSVKLKVIGEFKQLSCAQVLLSKGMCFSKKRN